MRYRLQRHDGTDCSATMVPIAALQWYRLQCYAWYRFSAIVNSKRDVKNMLQQIYDNLGLWGKTAKATDLSAYLSVKEKQCKNAEGKRVFFIEIM